MRFLFAFCVLWLMSYTAQAASFDCVAALHPVERAICRDDELSQLAEKVADRFKNLQHFIIKGDTRLEIEHSQWMSQMLHDCPLEFVDIAPCIAENYRERLYQLSNHPINQWPSHSLPFVRTGKLLPDYDIGLTLDEGDGCDSIHAECMGIMGKLVIYAKGEPEPHQVIELSYLHFIVDQDSQPADCADIFLEGCADIFGVGEGKVTAETFAGLFEVADYNFDGFPDFAFYDVNSSTAYAIRKYWVFLYDPEKKLFHYAPSFSEIFSAMWIDVDEEAKELESFNKQGCCQHVTTIYRVEDNMPIAVRRFSNDSASQEGFVIALDEVWQYGEWRVVKEERSAIDN